MKKIKIIRLSTGEDVIGEVTHDDDRVVTLKKPFVLIPRQMGPGKPIQLMLSPWQPYTDEEEILVNHDKIVTMVTPKNDIQRNYEENTSGIIQATAADQQLITETKLPKV
jgi:hypothetical protein